MMFVYLDPKGYCGLDEHACRVQEANPNFRRHPRFRIMIFARANPNSRNASYRLSCGRRQALHAQAATLKRGDVVGDVRYRVRFSSLRRHEPLCPADVAAKLCSIWFSKLKSIIDFIG